MTGPRLRPLQLVAGPPDFAQQLRTRRLQLELTQEQVAVRIGVRQQTVGAWEHGQMRPQPRFFPALVKFLDIADTSALKSLLDGRTATPEPPPKAPDAPQKPPAAVSAAAGGRPELANFVAALTDRIRHGPLSADEVALFREILAELS